MEVETVRRSEKIQKNDNISAADEAHAHGSVKPVFGPPVFRTDKQQKLASLRDSLKQVLGNFEDVAPHLGQGQRVFGVSCSPLTPSTPFVTKGPFFASSFQSQANPAVEKLLQNKQEKLRKDAKTDGSDVKSKSARKSDTKSEAQSQKSKVNGSGKKSKDSTSKSSNPKSKQDNSSSVVKSSLSVKITPPQQNGSPALSFKSPEISPLQAIKSMQNIVATPLSTIKDEPFKFPTSQKEKDLKKSDGFVDSSYTSTTSVAPPGENKQTPHLTTNNHVAENGSKTANIQFEKKTTSREELSLSESSDSESEELSSASRSRTSSETVFQPNANDQTMIMDGNDSQLDNNSKMDDPWANIMDMYLPERKKIEPETKKKEKKHKRNRDSSKSKNKLPKLEPIPKETIPSEPIQSPDSGFVEADSPGHKDEVFEREKELIEFKSVKSILDESRLSPLLSPLRQFPPLTFKDNKPSLKCRLNMSLVKNKPNGIRPIDDIENLVENDNKTATLEDDLDDMPLIERTRITQRPTTSSSSDSSSTNKTEISKKEVPKVKVKTENSSPLQMSQKSVSQKPNSLMKADQRPLEAANGVSKKETGSYKFKRKSKENGKSAVEMAGEPSPKKPKSETSVVSDNIIVNTTSGDHLDQTKPNTSTFIDAEDELKSADFYQNQRARPIKHEADKLTSDKLGRTLLYLESIVYFVMSARALEHEMKPESSRPYTMVKDTLELLRNITTRFVGQVNDLPIVVQRQVSRVEVLSLRAQAVLCFKLYWCRKGQVSHNYNLLTEYEKKKRANNSQSSSSGQTNHSSDAGYASGSGGSSRSISNTTPSPTPSPASSTGSVGSVPPGHITIPQSMESIYRQQFGHLNNLMWAHKHWEGAIVKDNDRDFFDHLDRICGPLRVDSKLSDLCSYFLTATHWLRDINGRMNGS